MTSMTPTAWDDPLSPSSSPPPTADLALEPRLSEAPAVTETPPAETGAGATGLEALEMGAAPYPGR